MEKRSHWKRPVIVLAALGALTVAALAAPASAHLGSFGHLKGHIKKIAKKVAKKEATTVVNNLGTTLFVEETELVRYGPIELSTGQQQAIGTFGPFTFTAECIDDGGQIEAQVILTTSEANSASDSDEDFLDDLDPGDQAFWAFFDPGAAPGDPQQIEDTSHDTSQAISSSGTVIQGITTLATNFSGAHCHFSGELHIVAPA